MLYFYFSMEVPRYIGTNLHMFVHIRVRNWEDLGLVDHILHLVFFALDWHQIIATLYAITKHNDRNTTNCVIYKL